MGGMAIARIVLKYFMMAVTLIVVAVPEGLTDECHFKSCTEYAPYAENQ